MARLMLSLFGPLQIMLDGQPLTHVESDKTRALLIYLAVEAHVPHRRSRLAHLLWPESSEKAARHSLSQALFNLRQVISDQESSPPFLLTTWQDIQFNPAGDIWVDVLAFRTGLALCQAHQHSNLENCAACLDQLEKAATLYKGSFLEQFFLPDCEPFEEWAETQRNVLYQQASHTWQVLADCYETYGDYETAEAYTRQQLNHDPYQEQAHRQLMRLLARQGRRQAALAQYGTYQQLLAETFRAAPTPETEALYRQIRDNLLVTPTVPVVASSPAPPRHVYSGNLPHPQTPFIGRQSELQQIRQYLLDPECRLVSLIGSGGVGKTRLALETARIQTSSFADGVYFVPLSALSSPDNIVPAIADTLQLSFYEGRDPRDQLLDYLSSQHMLLLLDNLEHLLSKATQNGKSHTTELFITDLLKVARRLKIVVTSREHLHLQQGQAYPVSGLAVPDAEIEAEMSAACQLFQERALRLQPDLELTDRASLVEICRLLEGNPLALELAATLVATLPLSEIAAEISHNLDALTVDAPDLEPRHRSIRAVFDSSWQTLSPSEQAVFARLSVFRGGFTREAVAAVADAALSDLTALVRKSLLSHHHGRYGMHELMRQYATEKLALMPDLQRVSQQQHSAYYGRYLNHRVQLWQANYQPAVLNDIAQEIENVRVGLSWLLTQAEVDKLAPYLHDLWRFYQSQGRLPEAVDMLNEAIALTRQQPQHSWRQAEWEHWLGMAYWGLGKLDTCQEHLQEAVRLMQRPMPTTNGRLLWGLLGQCIHQIFNRLWPRRLSPHKEKHHMATIAAETYEQMAEIAYLASKMLTTLYCTLCAVNMAEYAPPSPILAIAYANMMIACGSFGLHRWAEKYAQMAERVTTLLNDLPTLGAVAERHGIYRNAIGHWNRSEQAHEQAINIFHNLKDERNQGDCLSNLAYVAYFRGDFAQYKTSWARLGTIAQISRNTQHQSWACTGQAQGLVGLGRLDEAMAFLAKAEPLLEHGTATLIGKMGYYSIMALARLRRGEYLQAAAAADSVLALLEQSRPISYVVIYVYNELAEVYLTLWERALLGDPAVPIAVAALKEKAKSICRSFFWFSWLHPVGRPYALLYLGKCKWLDGQPYQARRAWQKSLLQAEKLQMLYVEGLAHYELGRRPKGAEGHEHLQRAKEIFTQLDAAYDLKQLDTLLQGKGG